MLAFFIVCCVTDSPVVHDHCDRIELNHYYDESAQPVFTQIIFWQWNDNRQRFDVRAWRLRKDAHRLYRYGGQWRVIWNENSVTRCVTAPVLRITWTQYDPELAERQVLSQCQRQPLAKGHK